MRAFWLLVLIGCTKGTEQPPASVSQPVVNAASHRLLTLRWVEPARLDVLDDRVVPLELPEFRGEASMPWRLTFTGAGGVTETFYSEAHDVVRGEFVSGEGEFEHERVAVEQPVFPARVPVAAGVLSLSTRSGGAFVERARLSLEVPR